MSEKYDVVIIGAGIGGLVCGCYLAKAGLKVIVVEQHDKPGGYCTSFIRNGYQFDVGGHYLSGLRKGWLNKVLDELRIRDTIEFKQFDPADKLIMPDNTLYIYSDIGKTISEFRKSFPKEKEGIEKFFNFILDDDFLSIYTKFKKVCFNEILDHYFKDNKLKAIIEVLLGSVGLCADEIPTVSAVLLFRNFIVDPGWYPKGGIQSFPDKLVEAILSCGGKVLLGKKVKRIIVEKNTAKRVILNDGGVLDGSAILSNADAHETFNNLLGVQTRERDSLTKLAVSPALFSVYLGLKKDFASQIENPANVWYFETYNIRDCYDTSKIEEIPAKDPAYFVSMFPFLRDGNLEKPTMELFVAAPFKTPHFWDEHREELMQCLIKKANKVFPGLADFAELKINATPQTFYHYTLNQMGAAYGWRSTTDLLRRPIFMSRTSVNNLYFTGHWCNGALSQGGVPQVSIIGRMTARLIMEDSGLKWTYKHSLL